MNKPIIQALIFDLGRVLVDVDFNKGLFPLLAKADVNHRSVPLERIYANPLFADFNRGRINARQFYESLSARYALRMNYGAFRQQWCAVFNIIPGMAEIIQNLSGTYPLGLLSDTDELHWEYCLHHFSFLKLFRNPTLSFKTGFMKPHPHCYRIAAENLNVPASRCLFIDDRPVNIEGAKAAGMKTILFKGPLLLRQTLNAYNLF